MDLVTKHMRMQILSRPSNFKFDIPIKLGQNKGIINSNFILLKQTNQLKEHFNLQTILIRFNYKSVV